MFGLGKNKERAEGTRSSVFECDKRLRLASCDLRDGQQSLLATRLKTEDMIPILGKLDDVGFICAEVWGGATFDVCLRYLNEDPWDRLRTIKSHMHKTPLRMLLRGQNLLGFKQYPDDIVERFIAKSAEAGMDIFLIFDILGDMRNCETAIKAVKKARKTAEGEISYAIGPVYDMALYAKQSQQLEKMGCEAIHVEDGSGILTPERAYELTKTLKRAVDVPVHLHCHSTGGLADLAYWEAIKAGVDVVDTNLSALALGTAQPPTESFVVALRETSRDTGLDLGLLEEINAYLLTLRKKYKEFESSFTGVDIGVFHHQVPGGMLSNLESQLKGMGAAERMGEVLREVYAVRKDFGYPPLGTPMAQIVGVQATMNVLGGERYKMVPTESKNYVKGMYGTPPGDIDPDVAKKVLGDESRLTCRPADTLEPAYERCKTEIGDLARTEEDVLSYAMFPQVAKDFLTKKYAQ
ncbi:MAG: pyruvate carboxylase subunit B [Treponemataceae bacterium]